MQKHVLKQIDGIIRYCSVYRYLNIIYKDLCYHGITIVRYCVAGSSFQLIQYIFLLFEIQYINEPMFLGTLLSWCPIGIIKPNQKNPVCFSYYSDNWKIC